MYCIFVNLKKKIFKYAAYSITIWYVENKKQVQFNLPNNYEESFYFEKAPYLTNPTPAVENKLINLIKNRDDLKKRLLATSDYGHEIQEHLIAVVGYDEKFDNAC